MADSIDLQKIHDTLVAVAFEAGRMILAANPSDISTGVKMNCILPFPPPPPAPSPQKLTPLQLPTL